MEPLTFRIGAVVEASPVAFGRAFADQAPAGTVYRGMVVGRDEDDDNGVAEGRRVWRVLYDDDDTVWPTAQEHLTPVRARPKRSRGRRGWTARGHNPNEEGEEAHDAGDTAGAEAGRAGEAGRPRALWVGAGAASGSAAAGGQPQRRLTAPRAAARVGPGLGRPERSSRPKREREQAGAAVSRWAAVQAAARRAPSPAFDAPPAKKAYKRARRVDAGAGAPHQRRLFALLDLDGTLFHMLPEAEVPTNLEAICEGVVPLDAPVPGPAAAATPARHVLCVRKGTRALLAALRACGATVRVVTANLMGVEAVAALAAHEAATEASTGDALPLEGWRGALDVTVVVDRAPGSKRLPDDVAAALRAQRTARCVILDDNPTAWAAPAKPHVWVVPQFDVRRPLTSQELHAELRLLPSISERCRAFFAPPVHAPPAARRTATPAPAPASAPSPRSAPEPAPAPVRGLRRSRPLAFLGVSAPPEEKRAGLAGAVERPRRPRRTTRRKRTTLARRRKAGSCEGANGAGHPRAAPPRVTTRTRKTGTRRCRRRRTTTTTIGTGRRAARRRASAAESRRRRKRPKGTRRRSLEIWPRLRQVAASVVCALLAV